MATTPNDTNTATPKPKFHPEPEPTKPLKEEKERVPTDEVLTTVLNELVHTRKTVAQLVEAFIEFSKSANAILEAMATKQPKTTQTGPVHLVTVVQHGADGKQTGEMSQIPISRPKWAGAGPGVFMGHESIRVYEGHVLTFGIHCNDSKQEEDKTEKVTIPVSSSKSWRKDLTGFEDNGIRLWDTECFTSQGGKFFAHFQKSKEGVMWLKNVTYHTPR